jgi:hypothetical protein
MKAFDFIKLVYLLILFPAFACQEVYNHPDFDDSKKIPVIEGAVHNGDGPFHVYLNYARPYNDQNFTSISGAYVSVTDNLGNTFEYDDQGLGQYTCPEGRMETVIGRNYSLHIELPDGNILESEPLLLPDTLSIERIYEKHQVMEHIERASDNDILVSNQQGTAMYVVVDPEYPQKAFYRITAMLYAHLSGGYFHESYQYIPVDWGFIDTVEISISTTRTYDCMHTFNYYSLPLIGTMDPEPAENEFLRTQLCYFLPDSKLLGPDTLNIIGQYYAVSLYTISHETYSYISEINEQLGSTSHLFDPIPTQIRGNMHCINDPEQEVLGMFEVSSVSTRRPPEIDPVPDCIDTTIVDTTLILPLTIQKTPHEK